MLLFLSSIVVPDRDWSRHMTAISADIFLCLAACDSSIWTQRTMAT